jgi:hypothetical protein
MERRKGMPQMASVEAQGKDASHTEPEAQDDKVSEREVVLLPRSAKTKENRKKYSIVDDEEINDEADADSGRGSGDDGPDEEGNPSSLREGPDQVPGGGSGSSSDDSEGRGKPPTS